jgi:DDE family transposase
LHEPWHWWGLLADRPDGFPWLTVAGRELIGITVIDLDASVVFAASEKENAQPTYKGGIGFCPNLATCDNTDDVLAIDPRPGNATSNCAADNIALLELAVARLPGRYRHRLLVRLDGAGFSHELLEHIANGGKVKGRNWEFSAGWSCTDREMDAIAQLPDQAWTPAIEQNGEPVDNAYVADLTGLLDLEGWQQKIPGLRVLVRDEPLHPRYRKRATDREKALGRRFQLIVTNTQVGQIAWLDARHRSHVHVENDVKQAKDLGLNNWPSRFWTINVAWTQIIALAANLLACYRHLALPEGDLRDAAPKLLRYRLWQLPARLTRGQRKRWLHLRADWPWTTDVINTWQAIEAIPAPT